MKWKKMLKAAGIFVGKAIINRFVEKGEKVLIEKKNARTAGRTTPKDS